MHGLPVTAVVLWGLKPSVLPSSDGRHVGKHPGCQSQPGVATGM